MVNFKDGSNFLFKEFIFWKKGDSFNADVFS